MKKALGLLLCLLLFGALAATVFAAPSRLLDDAGLLTESQKIQTEAMLNEVSQNYGIDVVVVTTHSLHGKSPEAFADDCYDYGGYGDDGVLLMICMDTRDQHISTSGKCVRAFTDSAFDDLEAEMLPLLSSGQYAQAFAVFSRHTATAMEAYNAGPSRMALVICLAIGILTALIVTGIMKGKLKTVRAVENAHSYSSDLQLSQCLDLFLYRNVTRRARPKDSSSGGTHRSSSGRSHGGRGGKF